jgi:thiosulfate/3-mercaptopyruvate sulfurtransferase
MIKQSIYRKGVIATMLSKKTLTLLGASVLLVALTAGSSFAQLGWGKKELDTEKAAVTLAREAESGGYKLVTTSELKAWIDQKKPMLIIDTMPYEDSYKKNHIPGAVQMEFPIPIITSIDDKTKSALIKLLGPDKDRTIVFYCGFVKCTRSHNGAMWAVKEGYKNVYRYPGGIKAWLEADYPVAKVK